MGTAARSRGRLCTALGLLLSVAVLVCEAQKVATEAKLGPTARTGSPRKLLQAEAGEEDVRDAGPGMMNPVFPDRKCELLPVNASATGFTAMLCTLPDKCSDGHVEIERLDKVQCEKWERMQVSKSPEHNEYIKTHYGPDAFLLEMEGLQKITVTNVEYRGNCVYRAAFRTGVAGRYKLSLQHIYAAYDGLNEILTRWPPLLDTVLLSQHPVRICSKHDVTEDSLAQFVGGQLSNPERYYVAPTWWAALPSEIPACDPNYPPEGLWLRVPGRGRTAIMPYGPRTDYVWTPANCRLVMPPLGTAKLCKRRGAAGGAAPLRVLLVGDSHMRVTYTLLRDHLLGNFSFLPLEGHRKPHISHFLADNFTLSAPDDEPASGAAPGGGAGAGALFVFKEENLLELLGGAAGVEGWGEEFKLDLRGVDVVVFNFGHHPASQHHWTSTHFAAALERVAGALARERAARAPPAPPLRVVFQGITAFPMRNDGFVHGFRDWRTVTRLHYWNQLSQQIMKRLYIPVMDLWSVTLPMLRTTFDRAHYFCSEASEAILLEAFSKVGICSSAGILDLTS